VSKKAPMIAFLGGIRSGKSRAAQERFSAELKTRRLKAPAYFATLQSLRGAKDASLSRRIAAHQAARPLAWATVEVGTALKASAEASLRQGLDAWLLDGAGAWAALRLTEPEAAVLAEWQAFLDLAEQTRLTVLVLDEVGLGGVGAHPAVRHFADLNGRLNQAACSQADEVYAVQAGLLQRLK
jgi:adenosyl cobinamide kinase/adenosyl cobinamide phosphate guanylyltransferase